MKITRYIYILFFVIGLLSCSRPQKILQQWKSLSELPGQLSIQFPIDHSVFPPEIAPPTIRWREKGDAQKWLVVISTSRDNILFSAFIDESSFQPDSILWAGMKNSGLDKPVTISVLGINGSKIVSGSECSIHTSPDSVGAPIFYRAVPLPFIYAVHNLEKIRWHLGDISSSQKAPALLENLPLCGNCHTFTPDGKTMAMDVDYANDKGSYVIKDLTDETVLTPDDIITWSSYKPEDNQQTFGLLSQISPDGRYVASTVKDRSIFVATEGLHYSQLFFPIKGIIVIYDRDTGEFFSLPGADNPQYVQSNPGWSPDGQWLYFARAEAYETKAIEQSKEVILPTELAREFIDGKRDFKFDIYRIPFNGGKGGKAQPLKGASQNGKSNYFPRVSPDGRHLVFCQADNFMLLQPDSKLYCLPPAGGEPRLLECNSDSMNSWHAWSPNSKWLVYSSKRRGAYTDLMLTHIDDNGHASPPALLENLSFENYAVNIPEFVNLQNRSWSKIVDQFSNQAHYYFTMARNKAGEKKLQEAIENFDRAIAIDPTYAKSYVYKGHIYFANDEFDKALQAYENAVNYIDNDDRLFQNLGTTRYKVQRYEAAVEAFDRSITLNEKSMEAHLGRALAYAKMERHEKAIADFDRALALDPSSAKVYHERGICNAILKKWNEAAEDLEKASRLDPENDRTLEKLGNCYYQLGHYQKAIHSYSLAISLDAENYKLYEYRGDSKYRLNNSQGALDDYTLAISLQPRAGTSFYRRGVVRIQLGDKTAGCQDLLMAQHLGIRQAAASLEKQCRP